MKLYLIPALLIYSLSLFSQSAYKFPEKFNSVYNFHPEATLKQLAEEKDVDRRNAMKRYIVNYVYEEQLSFDNNVVYMDWYEAEVYLLKLLDTVINKQLKSKKLDVFLQRLPWSNAYASRYGNIFFNIGMLCEAENEAFLATVMSHEASHYLLQHKIKELRESEKIFRYSHPDYSKLDGFYKQFQRYEMQADSFAVANAKRLGLNLESTIRWHESMDVMEDFYQRGRTYEKMMKASSLPASSTKKKKQSKYKTYSSHPSYIQRYDQIRKEMDNCKSCEKEFLIDSVYFFKLKKTAMEERKKIAFESCDFNGSITFSFMDYLYGSKGPKNLYFLVESIRRLMYAKPNLTEIGFLTERIEDPDLGTNKSVLEKPDYLYSSIKEYEDLKNHPFITGAEKPFRSYKDAFFYFSNEAIKKGLNEANLSLALYYYSVKNQDSTNKYLQKYIANGNGSSIEFAKELLTHKTVYIPRGKSLIIYNNVGNYTGGDFNYYLSQKKKQNNDVVKKELLQDTTKTELIMVNELLGAAPQKLYQMQKLINNILGLYDDDDVEMCKKVRVNSNFANENGVLSEKFKNHLLVFAPEWYSWLKEGKYDKIFYVDMVYQYKDYTEGEEYYNDYTGYYLDMNLNRPIFKDSFRSGLIRKKKDKEMLDEMNEFLYH